MRERGPAGTAPRWAGPRRSTRRSTARRARAATTGCWPTSCAGLSTGKRQRDRAEELAREWGAYLVGRSAAEARGRGVRPGPNLAVLQEALAEAGFDAAVPAPERERSRSRLRDCPFRDLLDEHRAARVRRPSRAARGHAGRLPALAGAHGVRAPGRTDHGLPRWWRAGPETALDVPRHQVCLRKIEAPDARADVTTSERAGRMRRPPIRMERGGLDMDDMDRHRSCRRVQRLARGAGNGRGLRPARQGRVAADDPAAARAAPARPRPAHGDRDPGDRRRHRARGPQADSSTTRARWTSPTRSRTSGGSASTCSVSATRSAWCCGSSASAGPRSRRSGCRTPSERSPTSTAGSILVTGPTGSGKTTTLAAMIDYINKTKPVHIVTVEDPIEVLHRDEMASINQREIGNDTDGLPGRPARGAPAGPRRDPDRRDARHRDGSRRDPGRRDRPPGDVDAAHGGCHRDREPRDRLLPAVPAEAGSPGAGRHAARHHLPAPRADRSTAAASPRWRS